MDGETRGPYVKEK
jgi:hypothetical protein